MVESIGFSTGGFEARYGDKMSSVLDIKYKKPKKFEANVAANLLGASAFVGFSTKSFHGVTASDTRQTNIFLVHLIQKENISLTS